MKKTLICSLILLASIFCSNAQHFGVPYGEAECIAVDLDGTLTIRALAVGKKRATSRTQAEKNALYNVIFKGVKVENNALLSRPLLLEPNAEEKYADFFAAFFSDGGAFTNFIDLKDKRNGSTRTTRNNIQASTALTVRVKRSELKQYLKNNNILKEDEW